MPHTRLINASEIASQCGNSRAANVVLVGVLAAVAGLPAEEMESAIQRLVPAKAIETNLQAFKEGMSIIPN